MTVIYNNCLEISSLCDIFVSSCHIMTVLFINKGVVMSALIKQIKNSVPRNIFTDITLSRVLKGSHHSRYGLVKRAINAGDILHLRRGLYTFGKNDQSDPVNLFEVAQAVYGPSYISFESALSHHGWIPEAVYTVTSACMKRSREFHTPLGVFSYTHVPSNKFYAGVNRIISSGSVFLLATPWRALVDYLYVHKKDWKDLKSMKEDLRIDSAQLKNVDVHLLDDLEAATRSLRVKKFIQHVKKEWPV